MRTLRSRSHVRAVSVALALGAALLAVLAPPAGAQQTKERPTARVRPPRVAPALPEVPGVAPVANERPVSEKPLPVHNSLRASDVADDQAAWEAAAPRDGAKVYTLGTGDVVKVSVFQQADMSIETRVSDAGTVTLPLLGPVAIGGGTPKQAEARIAALLRNRGFVKDPQVNVTITQFRSRQIAVLGYVNRPGRYPLEEGQYSVTDALSLAGGVIPGASDTVVLVRLVEGKPQRSELDLPRLFKGANLERNVEVRGGDTLYVDKAPTFYIYGEVQRPGAFRLEKDMTVMQGLSLGGGLTARGTEKNMKLTRRDAQGKVATLVPGMQDLLQPDDVVYVRESLF